MDTLCEAIEERKVHHFDILYFRDEINTSFKELTMMMPRRKMTFKIHHLETFLRKQKEWLSIH